MVPGGRISATSRTYQASAPSAAKSSTMRWLTAGSFSGLRQLRQRKTAIGTPQIRWREMHQSGRDATMLVMRSLPHCGVPFHSLDLLERPLAEGGHRAVRVGHGRFHADKPLLRGPEDDRPMAAPAVRVGVMYVLPPHQGVAFSQQGDDRLVGLEDVKPVIFGQPIAQMPAVVHVA